MDDIQELVKTTLSEVERILSTKTVVGEPITVEGNIFIPLVMMGFGFGGGGMARKGTAREGGGTGIGGGGAVKPVAVVVIAKDGSIRVEPRTAPLCPSPTASWKS